jgi:hypothetical protein
VDTNALVIADPDIPGTTSTCLSVPERQGKALLAWVQEPDVRPLFYGSSVTSPNNVEEFVEKCRVRRSAKPATSGVASQIAAAALPASMEAQASAIQATDQFRTQYQPFGAFFAAVPLGDLVAPQWWADTQYVDTLAAAAPAEDDLDGMFSFSFGTGRLARPMLLGTNGAAFASNLNDIGGLTPLRVARYSPDKVTFEFDVIPRPNWVWIAAVQEVGRLFVLNGVHHLLALLKAGRQHAFCLVRPVRSLGDLQSTGWNFQDPGLFKPAELTAARPPLLRDYLDDQHAADIGIRLRQSFLRLAVGSDPGVIPRVA